MIPTIAYALVDQRGNLTSVHLEHERAMSAVASRRGVIVQDLVLRDAATELQKLLEEAQNALYGILDGEKYTDEIESLTKRIHAELRRTA